MSATAISSFGTNAAAKIVCRPVPCTGAGLGHVAERVPLVPAIDMAALAFRPARLRFEHAACKRPRRRHGGQHDRTPDRRHRKTARAHGCGTLGRVRQFVGIDIGARLRAAISDTRRRHRAGGSDDHAGVRDRLALSRDGAAVSGRMGAVSRGARQAPDTLRAFAAVRCRTLGSREGRRSLAAWTALSDCPGCPPQNADPAILARRESSPIICQGAGSDDNLLRNATRLPTSGEIVQGPHPNAARQRGTRTARGRRELRSCQRHSTADRAWRRDPYGRRMATPRVTEQGGRVVGNVGGARGAALCRGIEPRRAARDDARQTARRCARSR